MKGAAVFSSSEHPHRWFMLAGVWAIYMSFGLTAATIAPLVQPISRDLSLDLSDMGGIMGAWPLVYIAAAIPASAFIDRYGLRKSLLVAAGIIALSAALRALATGPVSLFLAVAVFGIGGPLVSVGAPKLISTWFAGKERGTAMGIYMTGPAIGSIAALTLTNSVLMPMFDGRWRLVALLYACVAVLAGCVWFAIARADASKQAERDARAQPVEGKLAVYTRLVRLPSVRLILLLSIGIFFFNHGLNNWLPEILHAGGMTLSQAGFWSAVPTAVGVIGALLIPRYATPDRRSRVLCTLFVVAGIATLALQYTAPWLVASGLVAQGIARSAMMPIAVLLLMEVEEVGAKHMGAAGGLFFTSAEIGGVLGPLTIGIVAERTGGFTIPLSVMFVDCVLLLGVMMLLAKSSRRRTSA